VTYENKGLYLPYTLNGLPSGGTEDSTYVEAVEIQLTGDMANNYDVWYQATVSGYGPLGWAKNGELAGAMDIREHIISLDVRVLPKGSEAPGSSQYRLLNSYSGRLQIAEGGTTCVNEDGSPYSGWVDQDYKKWYFVDGTAVTGWRAIDGLRYYFAADGQLVENVDDILGKQSAYQIRVNKTLNCMTIYAKDENGNFTIPVKSCRTSVGDDTPLGSFKTPEKYRWRLMVNGTYTQYATRIVDGFLIHSPTYNTANNKDIIIGAYNLMGQTRSLGCVRVVTEEAKWIYDRCKLGTEVVVYEDAENPGPFHIPVVVSVNEATTYDPTDPAFQ
ncbi:MAG: L,D-transpeptidase, partial [bacterium]|nr:L,D-transpeptidase [bacterium]